MPNKDNENDKDSGSSDYNYDSYNKTNKDEITLKRSTFYGLVIIGMISLLISAFLGGYTFNNFVTPKMIVIPSSPPQGMDQPQGKVGQKSITAPQEDTMPNDGSPLPTARNNPVPSVDDDPMRGNKDAQITLIEFSDYQCPFCKRAFDETMPQIKHDYIDTGKIKHVFRDYPLPFHKNAFAAALAAQCAQDQQKYWQYHDLLFERQSQWQDQNATGVVLTFKKYAQELDMNPNMFDQCLDSKKYQEEVNKDIMHGSVYGISGTPTFYIGNEAKGFTQIIGAQPFSSFDNLFKYYESESQTQ